MGGERFLIQHRYTILCITHYSKPLAVLATEGFTGLHEVLKAHRDDIQLMGNAYDAWDLKHPGHYAVTWQPRLLDESSQGLSGALTRPADTSALTALVVEGLSVANS